MGIDSSGSDVQQPAQRDAEELAQQALDMRRGGARMDQIGEALGVDRRVAGRWAGHLRKGEKPVNSVDYKPQGLSAPQWEEFKRRYQTTEPATAICADFGINIVKASAWARKAWLPRKPVLPRPHRQD